MKIFFDHQIFSLQRFGGISRYFNELMKIENDGIAVERLDPELFSEHYDAPRDLVGRGVNYFRRKTGTRSQAIKEQIDLRVKSKFQNTHFDIFHPTYYDPYFLDYTNKPFVLTVYDMVHEIFHEYFPLSDKTSHNKRMLCNKASAIIAISHNTKKDLVDIFNIPAEKIHAIPLASEFDKIEPVPPASSEGLNNYILFVGNRWGYKNFYFPTTAISGLLKEDRSIQLVCTGHPFNEEELQFFRDMDIANQVKHVYLDGDQELAWTYQHARLFMFPSLYEGFGFPILEAFASGCPVISSTGGSLPEVGGEAVIYFNPKSKIDIESAARKVFYDQDLRKELVEKGKRRFGAFNWGECRKKTVEVYNAI